jgi:uncharacterized protein (TIGR04255 family)
VYFGRERLPRIQFARNPLKVVISQMRFPAELALAEPAAQTRIQGGLRERYPLAQPLDQMNIQFSIGPQAMPPVSQSRSGGVRFTSEAGEWAVTVGTDALSLQATAYHDWDDFKHRFEEVLDVVLAEARVRRVDRLGLRFIDELSHPEARTLADWARFLDPALLGSAATDRFSAIATRTTEQVVLEEGDDGAVITHAYFQNPPESDPPSALVVDTDGFSARPFDLDRAEIRVRLERYHDAAWSLFRETVREPMIEWLGVEP